jgi:uncharacterized protein
MHRKIISGLALALLLALPLVAAPTLTMVPMEDGTRLATDVHVPEGEGPWPTILMRSTYGRLEKVADEWLVRGYAVVIQDVRGMGDSEGDAHVFYAEGWREGQTDGADTMAWVKAQPWCNGKVGSWGGSALAITEMLLAPTTPDLRIQHMVATPSNLYHDTAYHGGVLRKKLIEGWLTAIKQPHIIDVYKGHPRYDDYWAHFDTLARATDINAPGIFENGWYDIFQQGTIDGFLARQQYGNGPAKGNSYLIMKWSSHGHDVQDDYKLKKNRHDLKIGELRYRIFHHYLQGEGSIDDIPKVHYYVMGADTPNAPGNEWRTADDWPPYPTRSTNYYLTNKGGLSTETPDVAGRQSFVFDPANPVLTHGGNNLLMPSGAFDQAKHTEGREDILRFRTPPLESPLEITGRISLLLHISTDAPDTDFTAMLLDIYPDGDGRQLNIIDNIRRVKTRDSFETAAPLLSGPEQIVTLEIDLWSAAWIFEKGHQIGLNISSSNHPRFEVNPNTGEDFPGEKLRAATNSVHFSSEHPSMLVLPVR